MYNIYWSLFSQCTWVSQVFFFFFVTQWSWSWEKKLAKKNSRQLLWLWSEKVTFDCNLKTYGIVETSKLRSSNCHDFILKRSKVDSNFDNILFRVFGSLIVTEGIQVRLTIHLAYCNVAKLIPRRYSWSYFTIFFLLVLIFPVYLIFTSVYMVFFAIWSAQRGKIPSCRKKLAIFVLTNFWKGSILIVTQSYSRQSIFSTSKILHAASHSCSS